MAATSSAGQRLCRKDMTPAADQFCLSLLNDWYSLDGGRSLAFWVNDRLASLRIDQVTTLTVNNQPSADFDLSGAGSSVAEGVSSM